MTDPYQTLGVPKDATPNLIAKQYRRLIKRYHPDRNPAGDADAADKFAAVDAAYRLLSDPDRRARYDATGDAGEPRATTADPTHAELCATLQPFLVEVLMSLGGSLLSTKTTDVVARLRGRVDSEINGVETHRAAVETGRNVLREAMGRFEVPEGVNPLSDVARAQLAAVEAELERTVKALDKLTRAKEHLKTAKYRTDGGFAYTDGLTDFMAAVGARHKKPKPLAGGSA